MKTVVESEEPVRGNLRDPSGRTCLSRGRVKEHVSVDGSIRSSRRVHKSWDCPRYLAISGIRPVLTSLWARSSGWILSSSDRTNVARTGADHGDASRPACLPGSPASAARNATWTASRGSGLLMMPCSSGMKVTPRSLTRSLSTASSKARAGICVTPAPHEMVPPIRSHPRASPWHEDVTHGVGNGRAC